ncbi:hypothetical protein [uncultured Ruegeria sp.]|nr:hypothetical protein [uncultured Ruegeria sp.]
MKTALKPIGSAIKPIIGTTNPIVGKTIRKAPKAGQVLVGTTQ